MLLKAGGGVEKEKETYRCMTASYAWRMLNVHVHCLHSRVNVSADVRIWVGGCIYVYTISQSVLCISKCMFNIRCCALNFRQTCVLFAHILIACHICEIRILMNVMQKQFYAKCESIEPPSSFSITHTHCSLVLRNISKKDNAFAVLNNVVCMNSKFVYFSLQSTLALLTKHFTFIYLRFAFARFLCAFILKNVHLHCLMFALRKVCYNRCIAAAAAAADTTTATQLKSFIESERHAHKIHSYGCYLIVVYRIECVTC